MSSAFGVRIWSVRTSRRSDPQRRYISPKIESHSFQVLFEFSQSSRPFSNHAACWSCKGCFVSSANLSALPCGKHYLLSCLCWKWRRIRLPRAWVRERRRWVRPAERAGRCAGSRGDERCGVTISSQRAWCVAEIAEASKSRIPPFLKVASSKSIDQHFDKIETLDVSKCEASWKPDKDAILEKIEESTSIELFNAELRRIIQGIAFRWMRDEANALRRLIAGQRLIRLCEANVLRRRVEKKEVENHALRSELKALGHAESVVLG